MGPPFHLLRRVTLALALAALPLIAGCTTEADRASLQQGFAKYQARQPEESESIADKLITSNPYSPSVDEAYYLRGLSRMLRGNRAGASADLHEAIQKTSRADLKGKASWALGDIAYDQSQWDEAQKDYQQALSSGAVTGANVAYLNYRVGASLQNKGEWTAAQSWFGRAAGENAAPDIKERAVGRMYASSFSLQYGAFHEGPRAREMANQLQAAGVPPVIKSEMREGQILYLVQSGSYHTMADVIAARERMQAKYPLVAIVP
jgi:tetratricopeptide (TPR) repeat protein